MLNTLISAGNFLKRKLNKSLHRLFKNEKGSAELISTVGLIAVAIAICSLLLTWSQDVFNSEDENSILGQVSSTIKGWITDKNNTSSAN